MKPSQNFVYSSVLAPTTAATTARTAYVDCKDANYAVFTVQLSAELNTNSTNVALTFTEADDTEATSFATFSATANRTVDNTAAAVAVTHIDMEARKRYIKVAVTPDTTTNGAVASAVNVALCKVVQSGTASDFGDDVARV